MSDNELIEAMFDKDPAIARKAKELYDARREDDGTDRSDEQGRGGSAA